MRWFPVLLVSVAAAMISLPARAQFTDRNENYLRGQVPAKPQASAKPQVPFGTILNNVGRQIGGSYMGQQYDPATQTYRLRFMQGGAAVDVYVDARTGRIVGREGF